MSKISPVLSAPLPAQVAGEGGGRTGWLLVVGLLLIHYALAASSLVRENPTVDEVLHLPAGITYWQTGSFQLYRHNPPLVKLVAALPALALRPETGPIYQSPKAWRAEYPSQATFGQYFQLYNTARFFEIFTAARLVMPLFSVLGGLVVYFWSRQLHGQWGGLLSLALWCFCPNILAHARLVTSDVGSAALGCASIWCFWRFLQAPSWSRCLLFGAIMGLTQASKFSALLLYGIVCILWVFHEVHATIWKAPGSPSGFFLGRAWKLLVALMLSVLVIDAVYCFEGVGTPLGRFDFASRTFLTRPGEDMRWRTNPSTNPLIDQSWKHRVNRFRGTWLGLIPSPLPRHYLLGFDEQKIEADGIPMGWLDPKAPNPDEITGYPVYLDGQLRRTGWRDYYLKTLLYKVPEGTWLLVGLAFVAGLTTRAGSGGRTWFDGFTLAVVPVVLLFSMSFLTDINLGLRYILPVFPYTYIGCGILVPWVGEFVRKYPPGRLLWTPVLLPLLGIVLAIASIHPHYLAYFNLASGGPRRGSEHLIDSNLDWGQDLVGLRAWLARNPQPEPIGLAYFGQVSPQIFAARGEGFDWFVPPAIRGRIDRIAPGSGGANQVNQPLKPGLYAVSASLVRGLPWRLYEPTPLGGMAPWVMPAWNTREDAFAYFRELTPLPESIGYSILLYRVSQADADRLNARYWPTSAWEARGSNSSPAG